MRNHPFSDISLEVLRRFAGSASALVLSACGLSPGAPAYLTLTLPNGPSGLESAARSSLMLSTDSPGCPADLYLGARSDAGEEVEAVNLSSRANLNWIRYFSGDLGADGPPLLYGSSSLTEVRSAALPITSGEGWNPHVHGGAVLKCDVGNCKDPFVAVRGVLGTDKPFGGAGTGWDRSDWSCVTDSFGFWDETNLLDDQLEADGATPSDASRLVVPFLSLPQEESLTLAPGERRAVDITVRAARVPFGAYSETSMVGEESSGAAADVAYGNFDGASSTPGPIVDHYLAPFYALKLTALNSRVSITDPSKNSSIEVIPLLKEPGTGQVWRGVAEMNLSVYSVGQGPFYIYPIPGPHYRVALVLKCAGTNNCGTVILNGATGSASTSVTWTSGASLCLMSDINLKKPNGTSITEVTGYDHLREGTLSDPEWLMRSDGFSTDAVSQLIGVAPGDCVTQFLAD
jgi:hypothetical protein